MTRNPINVTSHDLEELKKCYRECKEETFMFKGHVLLKGYAKYLIEYLEGLAE